MADEYGQFIKKIEYDESDLPLFLQYDNWSEVDGLLLLSGLSPKKSKILPEKTPPDSIIKENRKAPNFQIRVLHPLDAGEAFGKIFQGWTLRMGADKPDKLLDEAISDPRAQDVQDILELAREEIKDGDMEKSTSKLLSDAIGGMLPKPINDKQARQIFETVKTIHEKYERKFRDLCSIWYSGDHLDREKDRYPVKDFIIWAERKKIDVPWLEWAKEKGLHNKEEPPVQTGKALDPRPEKTFAKEGPADKNFMPITTKGNDWKDIRITLLDGKDDILVQILNTPGYGKENDSTMRTYMQAGFADRKTGKPNESWNLLKVLFLEKNKTGSVSSRPDGLDMKLNTYQKKISRIKKSLKELFPDIKGEPIYLHQREYRIAFSTNHFILRSS